MKKVKILDHASILSKLDRIAYEIAERNFGEEEIVLLGMNERGSFLAKELSKRLKKISSANIQFLRGDKVKGNKVELTAKEPAKLLKAKIIIIVDDVLYSGRTIFDALSAVMQFNPATVQTALLIDRGHRNIPVSPDYVGLTLATTLKQHVYVELSKDGKSVEAFLG